MTETVTQKNLHGQENIHKTIHTCIDKFYISSLLNPFVNKTDILPFSFSDHDLILCTLDLQTQPCREGYWHFIISLR